jgi:pyruvate kinase
VRAELCGPKIRTGTFEGGSIELEEGSTVTVTVRDVVGQPGVIPSQYEPLARDVHAGARILLDDGTLELRVEGVDGTEIECTVIVGGRLKNRKGMNLPGVGISAPSLTAKDRVDAKFAVELGADLMALSFVRSSLDVAMLRELITEHGRPEIGIISKIEKPEALEDIEGILQQSDGIMVARGDLGVELPAETVPTTQDQLVDRARAAHKPVIIATQMLDSMIDNPRPTRAEVTDVAAAVKSGADAVMLSGETAAGKYPIRAVRMLNRVIRHAEGYLWSHGAFGSLVRQESTEPPLPTATAIGRATSLLSRDLRVRGIVAISRGGTSVRMLSAARPAAPLLAAVTDPPLCRRLMLLWGVFPSVAWPEELDKPRELGRRLVAELGIAVPGDVILTTQGYHDDPALSIPSMTVVTV